MRGGATSAVNAEIPSKKEKIDSAIDLAEDSKEKSQNQNDDENSSPEIKIRIETKWDFSIGAVAALLNKAEIKSHETYFSTVNGILPLAVPSFSADFSFNVFDVDLNVYFRDFCLCLYEFINYR